MRDSTAHRRTPAARRPRRWRPPLRGILLSALILLALPLVAPLGSPAVAQTFPPRIETAELPESGELRIGTSPTIQTWHERFTVGGEQEPLGAGFDGPILDRIFPGPAAVLERVNADADALGFDPLDAGELSLGALDVRDASADLRTVPVRVELGILDRVALDIFVPSRKGDLEVFAAYDSTSATVGAAAAMMANPGVFFGQVSDARAALQNRIESGSLAAGEEETARELLESSGRFVGELQRRVMLNALLPLAGTRAGDQILIRYGMLASGFADFNLSLPELALPILATSGDLAGFFGGALLDSPFPGTRVRPWSAGGVEVGLRIGLLDDFAGPGLGLRTTVGVRARLSPPATLLSGARSSLRLAGLPVTRSGERDVELSLYQDFRLGGLLVVSALARHGIRSSRRLRTRVRSPDRPFALPATERTIERNPGAYQRIRISPRLRLERRLSAGLAYSFWRTGRDEVRLADGSGELSDAAVLEQQTAERRHRIGIAVEMRPGADGDVGAGEGAEGDPDGDRQAEESGIRLPEIGLRAEFPVAGSGGLTPASTLYTFHLRLPIRIF